VGSLFGTSERQREAFEVSGGAHGSQSL
jgi:hypothetical protein